MIDDLHDKLWRAMQAHGVGWIDNGTPDAHCYCGHRPARLGASWHVHVADAVIREIVSDYAAHFCKDHRHDCAWCWCDCRVPDRLPVRARPGREVVRRRMEEAVTTLYCYDTEFLENGHTIELISIGIVCEDGREYYAINADADWDRIRENDWLMENVVAHLPTHSTGQVVRRTGFGGGWSWGGINMRDSSVKPKWVIANEVRDFLLARPNGTSGGEWQPHPELWAYYAAYDHVALAQLWGRMIGLPKGIPMWTNDLQQELFRRGVEPPSPPDDEHNALADARWVLKTLNGLRVERGQ